MSETRKIAGAARPRYLYVLLAFTGVYLLVECAFNARLLDIAGGKASPEAVEHIEFWGRLISGTALALAVCGSILFPWLHRRGGGPVDYAGLAVLVFVPVVLLVFHGEKLLIDTLSERSSTRERKVAALLSLASSQLRQGELLVQGINLNGAALHSPEGKSFVALFSPLVSHLPNAVSIVERELDSLVRQAVTRQLPSVEDFYHGQFAQSFKPLQAQFTIYAQMVETYRENRIELDRRATRGWSNYVAELKKRGRTPGNVRAREFQQVRRMVQNSGIPVPNNWAPSDKAGFLRAFISTGERRAMAWKRERFAEHGLPEDFPLNLGSFDAFLRHKHVQAVWKKSLGFPDNAQLGNGMNLKIFETRAYIPWRESQIEEKKKMLRSDAEDYMDGGRFEQVGKDAVRGVIVPPIALLFSLLGALVHVCKTGFYLLRLVFPSPRIAALINVGLFALLLILPLHFPNSVTGTEVYTHVERKIMENHPVAGMTMRWIILAQSRMYPANAWVREVLLRGARFGASPEDET